MNSYQEILVKHCNKILTDRRIFNKIVVLCEGQGSILDNKTVVNYGKMERMPDANFYRKCVPRSWSQGIPVFFNCKGRTGVIDTYFKLLELNEEDSKNSYLTPDKLFAIVDLDLQSQNIENYLFSNTEEIFSNLYQQGQVNEENVNNHRIWVTGLIHKEAYFIIPELQDTFHNHINIPMYNGQPIVLEDIYITMADAMINSEELKNLLPALSNRISYCTGLDCSDLEKLHDSWKAEFENAQDENRKNELIRALLMIKKVKNKTTQEDYWQQIKPPIDWTNSEESFRDELLLQIAQFYSEQSNYAKYHIPYFIQFLRQFI
ncbi:hypothetical protein WJM97_18835 [Okeanomitos corallinicola TIOX110]|uniref:DUF4435 domain-containing protein n=1 Tax=Okeanomitos corallinicola TIOX110 TaxID=3133117 RepID=A0ABZ2UPW2_9CYAN